MITQERSIEIRILAKQRKKIREIARTMGISKNTARRYLRSKTWQRYKKRLKRPWSEAADYRRDRLSPVQRDPGESVLPSHSKTA
jgi:transposase